MNKNSIASSIGIICLWFGVINSSYSMGLRSFVALPVEKEDAVIRFAFEHAKDSDTDVLTTNIAYGLSSNQTLLFGLLYRISPTGDDVSALYRHIVSQKDSQSGTERLGLLGGVIIPTEDNRDAAAQAGLIFTQVKNRHEIDIDALYQSGTGRRADSGRYDLSWQYRLSPSEYPD